MSKFLTIARLWKNKRVREDQEQEYFKVSVNVDIPKGSIIYFEKNRFFEKGGTKPDMTCFMHESEWDEYVQEETEMNKPTSKEVADNVPF